MAAIVYNTVEEKRAARRRMIEYKHIVEEQIRLKMASIARE